MGLWRQRQDWQCEWKLWEGAITRAHTKGILAEIRTVLQNPDLENCPFLKSWQWIFNLWELYYKLKTLELVPRILGDANSASVNAENGKEWVMNLHLSWNFGIGGTHFSFIFSPCIRLAISTLCSHNCNFWKHRVCLQDILLGREFS